HLQGIENNHAAEGDLVQVFTHAEFKKPDVDDIIPSRYPDLFAEVAYALRCIPPSPHTAYGRHAGVVPTGDMTFIDQLEQLAFAHNGVVHIKPGKFVLFRGIDLQLLNEPVIQFPMRNELQGAYAVSYVLDRIRLTVREIVHWINTPGVAGPVVGCAL